MCFDVFVFNQCQNVQIGIIIMPMAQYVSTRRSYNGLTRVEMEDYFDNIEIENLYQWIDRIPLTRPKKNLAKDFSDGVLVAELIKYYFPRMVDLHNYAPAHSSKQKKENWYLLNRKVLQRLDLDLSDEVIQALSSGKIQVVEKVLMMLRNQLDKAIDKRNALKQRTKLLHDTLSKVSSSTTAVGSELFRYSKSLLRRNIHHGQSSRGSLSTIKTPLPVISPPVNNVAKSLLDEKELESMAQDETIKIMSAKLNRLEHLLHLKDLRIEELESQLDTTSYRQMPVEL